jgi:hypothetical protein
MDLEHFFKTQWRMLTKLSNGNELSTVHLPTNLTGMETYESCWFYPNGKSEVVARYFSREKAVEGHCELLRAG